MSRLRPRAAWTDTAAASPALLAPHEVVGLAVHWIGPPVPAAVLAGDEESVARFLRGVRRFHVSGRGWSDIAYQQAVDAHGRRWDLRGWTRRSAANGDTGPNRRWGAVVALLGTGQLPSGRMLAGLTAAVADFRTVYPGATRVATHAQVRPDPTSCPGPDLTRWVTTAGYREESDMTLDELVKALRDDASPLSRQLRRHVRESVQEELRQERAGENP